jgi:hypothetical protein
MKASPQTLWNLLSAKRRFRIPLYQRRYGWQDEHCAALWKDLARVYKNPDESHYLGCLVVTAADPNGFHSIVDGQQRLTSLTLLLRSIADALPPQEEEILLSWLRDSQGGWWIVPQDWGEGSDLKRFDHAMRQGPPEDGDPFGRNLRDFRMAIADRPGVLTLDGVQDALSRIILSLVELEKAGPDYDDQALIFEKMNAEGLNLEPHDLIRNRVFLLAAKAAPAGNAVSASQRQRDLFRNEWLHLEHLFERRNLSEMSHFFRDYLILKTGKDDIHAGHELPERFKNFLHDRDGRPIFDGRPLDSTEAVECLVNDLWRYAAAWCRVVQARPFAGTDAGTQRLNAALREFKLISNALVLPLATRLILDASSERARRENVALALESLARFIGIGLLTGEIPRRLPPEIADKADDVAAFATELCGRWPPGFDWKSALRQTLVGKAFDDREVPAQEADGLAQTRDIEAPDESASEKNEYQGVDVYHLNRRALIFLLLKIHGDLMQKIGDTPMAFTEQDHTFEHIMPQTLDGEWMQLASFREAYLHSLGNLTLVGSSYNPSISNRPLEEKVRYYQDSSYTLTRNIAREIPKALAGENGRWDLMKLPAYLDRRTRELADRAVTLLNPHHS